MIPLGKDSGQYSLKKINNKIKTMTKENKYILFNVLTFIIRLRKLIFKQLKIQRNYMIVKILKNVKNN